MLFKKYSLLGRIIFLFVLSGGLFSQAHANQAEIWATRALEIKSQTDQLVVNDMDLLMAQWQVQAPKLAPEAQRLRLRVEKKLRQDKEALGFLLKEISLLPEVQKEEVGLDLSSNGKKFSSTFIDHILSKIHGEYAPLSWGAKIDSKKVQWVEIKTLLLYFMADVEGVSSVQELRVFPQIRFIYGYEMESFINTSILWDHFLFDKNNLTLYMPNSGYVFGGTLRRGENRGLDCSAFITQVLQSEFRPSSLLLEVLWKREMGGDLSYFDTYPERLQELIEKWDLLELERDYQAVAVKGTQDLMPGDVVVWRSQGSDIFTKSGHVLMVLDTRGLGNNRFLGIDLRRDEDQEGHYTDQYNLFLKGKDTFVVRKRTGALGAN